MSKTAAPDPLQSADVSAAHKAALLDFAVQNSSAVFYLADMDQTRRTRFISDNVLRITGHHPTLFVTVEGFGATQIHPDDKSAYFEAMDSLGHADDTTIEYRYRHAEGHWLWIRDTLRQVDQEDDASPRLIVGNMVDITTEKEAVARQQRTEAINRALLANMIDAIVATDENGLVIEFNAAAERMFGYSRVEAIGQEIGQLIIPAKHLKRHQAGMEMFRKNGRMSRRSRRMETSARTASGRIFPVEIAIATTEIDGRSIVIGDIQDISDRVAAREERQRLMQLLQDAVGSMTEGFAISDADGRIQFCNKAFAKPYGVSPEALVGGSRSEMIDRFFKNLRRFDGRIVEGDRSQIDWILERMLQFDGPGIEMETTSGEWRLIINHPTTDGGAVTIRADISGRKKAEQSLRESEAMIRRILDACPIPVGMTHAEDGRIIYESPASRELFQRDPTERAVSARDFFVLPKDRARYLVKLRRDGKVDAFETRLRRTDGQEFPASISARLVDYQNEEVIVSSVFDLTEMRRIETEMARQREALHQTEKMSALGELLAGVSHELNNPLSVVVGQALLLRETAGNEAVAARAEKIGDAADRCARIVKTFLAMARQQPREMTAVQLNAIVEGSLEITGYMLRTNGIDISLDLMPDLPTVMGDPDQLNQVLTNLIVNALHAMDDGKAPHRLYISSSFDPESRDVVLLVRDTGKGIARDATSRVFEPFFTTKEVGEGTGIGLAIVHRIVETHGGSIVMESEPDAGATFILKFPAHDADQEIHEATEAPTGSEQLQVLVIDDEPEVAEIIRESLITTGHRVDIETSGEAALRRIMEVRYDAILSDVRMPGLDGQALYRILKERFPEQLAGLGFVTGDTMSPSMSDFLGRAGRPHLEKPAGPLEIRNLVARLVEREK